MVDYQALYEGLIRQLEAKDEMIRELLERIDEKDMTIKEQNQTIEKLSDIISTYERKLYGTSSEKTHREDSQKKDESGNEEDQNRGEDSPQTPSDEVTERKKNKPYTHPHKRDYGDITPDEVIELRPNDEDLKGARLIRVNSSYRFFFVPSKICKVRYDRYIYSKDGHLITPRLPYVPEDLEKRHATPELIASLLVNKFQFHLPIERQLAMLNTGDIQIAKTTLHDWVAAGIDALDGAYEAIRLSVLSDDRMHIDETTMPIADPFNHTTRKGYDWGFISPTSRMMFFTRCKGSRGTEVLDSQMKDYKGLYIQTDGYGAYVNVGKRLGREIIHIPCLAHIKRKFFDSRQFHRKKADEALAFIDIIFKNERGYREKNLTREEVENLRELELRPILNSFKQWLEDEINDKDFFDGSNIGKAIVYAYERIDQFYELINNGLLDASNNLAERTMRSHAMGRKNFLFCQSEESALRTCKIYSIIESCKMCGVSAYDYICACLKKEPESGESWATMLPSNFKIS